MSKLANMMTRVVAIGTLKEGEYKSSSSYGVYKGIIDAGKGNNVRFTIWDRNNGDNPHTKAKDFSEQFKVGDKVYITGQDNRTYNEETDRYYEDINVWEFRSASEDEQPRWVFVYVGDLKDINEDGELVLSLINYKDEEMLYPINVSNLEKPEGLEQNCRIKVKGTIFSGFKEDFYGDGEFVVERVGAQIIVLNSAEEVIAEQEEASEESELWD